MKNKYIFLCEAYDCQTGDPCDFEVWWITDEPQPGLDKNWWLDYGVETELKKKVDRWLNRSTPRYRRERIRFLRTEAVK